MSYIDSILKEIEEITPEKGYVVCEFDDYSKVGERLTVIKYVNTLDEAYEIVKANEDKDLWVYGGENGKEKE